MITGKIDVLKIDKTRLYKGAKGIYLSFSLIPTPESQYGDYMIVEATTAEERGAGIKGAILGNAKILANKPAEPPKGDRVPDGNTAPDDDNDLPF